MTPQKQKFKHDPANGIYGDCHRTAIACILDMDRDSVPHFAENNWNTPDTWRREEEDFLASQGFKEVYAAYDWDFETFMQAMENTAKGVYYILGGKSKNGTDHSVVACGGRIVWDPAIDDSGIVGPMSDGWYWTTFFIPLRFTNTYKKESDNACPQI